jgi:hypothetical protein
MPSLALEYDMWGTLELMDSRSGSNARALVIEDHVWFEDRWMVASLCDE